MPSVFKRGRDKGKRNAVWYFSYEENGRRRTKKGFTDKQSTVQLARELERQARRKKEGLVDPNDQKRKTAAETPIEDHLKAFEASISKNTGKHVKLTMTRVRRLVSEAEIKTISDIEIESLEAVLGDMLEAEEIGHKTYNHYVQSMSQFCNWLVPSRVAANPIAGMSRLNADVDVRHPRRALTPEEFQRLVQSARSSEVSIQCYDGEERARIYILSYMTGLRRKEIASLTPSSFKLNDSPPTLTVEAMSSKHRKKDVLPLHPELVSMLKEWLKGIKRSEPLFPKLAKRRTWLMVKKDLERVGIPYQTEEGIADFHAAGRHTHITELLRSGATLPEARELARHSDVRTTMKYTHIGIDDQARAVSQLKWEDGKPERDEAAEDDEESWQRYGSGTCIPNGHSLSSPDRPRPNGKENDQLLTQGERTASGNTRPSLAATGTEAASKRDAGSIPAASTESRLTIFVRRLSLCAYVKSPAAKGLTETVCVRLGVSLGGKSVRFAAFAPKYRHQLVPQFGFPTFTKLEVRHARTQTRTQTRCEGAIPPLPRLSTGRRWQPQGMQIQPRHGQK